MLWTKEAHQCTIFRLLGSLLKVHPTPHAIFETARSGFIQILHHCLVSWKITPLYFFSSNLINLAQKLLDFWVVGWNSTKSQVSFSFNLHHSSMSWEIVFCTFLAENLYDFYKRSPPQCKISAFWLLWWNFTKFIPL